MNQYDIKEGIRIMDEDDFEYVVLKIVDKFNLINKQQGREFDTISFEVKQLDVTPPSILTMYGHEIQKIYSDEKDCWTVNDTWLRFWGYER